MLRVTIGGKLHPFGIERLKSATGIISDNAEEVSTESLMPALLEADALLIRTQPLPANFIKQAENLKVVSRRQNDWNYRNSLQAEEVAGKTMKVHIRAYRRWNNDQTQA